MDNLLHFPTNYTPTFEESQRLESWQRQWKVWRMELVADWDKLGLDGYQRMISRQKFYTGCRDNWKIYPGFKKEVYTKTKSL